MALHKIVNGVKIDLTEQEEAETREEWNENNIKKAEAKRIEISEENNRVILKQKLAESVGMTMEEIDFIFNV